MRNQLPKFLLNDNSNTAVVFIHGLGGSYYTWNKFAIELKNNWEEKSSFSLLYDEYYPRTIKIPGFTFIYRSAIGASIDDLARHLESFINTVCERFTNVILVCHSMGGLVARKYIVNILNRNRSIGKIRGLITYATPHHGATLASIGKTLFHTPALWISIGWIKLFYQIKDLTKGSTFITTLNSEWSTLNASSKLDFLRVIGLSDGIVSEFSASFSKDQFVTVCANKGHFSIIQPHPNIYDIALYVTYNYLKKFNRILEEREEFNEDDYPEEDYLEY